jgi:hypothetical protein
MVDATQLYTHAGPDGFDASASPIAASASQFIADSPEKLRAQTIWEAALGKSSDGRPWQTLPRHVVDTQSLPSFTLLY